MKVLAVATVTSLGMASAFVNEKHAPDPLGWKQPFDSLSQNLGHKSVDVLFWASRDQFSQAFVCEFNSNIKSHHHKKQMVKLPKFTHTTRTCSAHPTSALAPEKGYFHDVHVRRLLKPVGIKIAKGMSRGVNCRVTC